MALFQPRLPRWLKLLEGQDGNQAAAQARTTYGYSYPKVTADSENPFIVYTGKHLHKPGDEVRIHGYIWSGLLAKVDDPSKVLVQVRDSTGTTLVRHVTPINSDGGFSANISLLNTTEPGIYYIYPQVQLQADVGTLSADTLAKLQPSSTFLVASPNAFAVEAEGK